MEKCTVERYCPLSVLLLRRLSSWLEVFMQGNICRACKKRPNEGPRLLWVIFDIVSWAVRVRTSSKNELGALLRVCWGDFITGENSDWHKEVARATMGEGWTGYGSFCWPYVSQRVSHLLSLDQPWINNWPSIFLHLSTGVRHRASKIWWWRWRDSSPSPAFFQLPGPFNNSTGGKACMKKPVFFLSCMNNHFHYLN